MASFQIFLFKFMGHELYHYAITRNDSLKLFTVLLNSTEYQGN